VQYNLCNEPRIKYSMAAVADRGLKPSQWTSARLRGEVMVLETHRARYELSRNAPPPDAPAEALHVRPPQALAVAARWAEAWRWALRSLPRAVGDALVGPGPLSAAAARRRRRIGGRAAGRRRRCRAFAAWACRCQRRCWTCWRPRWRGRTCRRARAPG
jgi:hypothetical protein